MHQLEIKVLDIVDARCNHEVYGQVMPSDWLRYRPTLVMLTPTHQLQISIAKASVFCRESDYSNFRVHEWATNIVFVAFVNEATAKVCFGSSALNPPCDNKPSVGIKVTFSAT